MELSRPYQTSENQLYFCRKFEQNEYFCFSLYFYIGFSGGGNNNNLIQNGELTIELLRSIEEYRDNELKTIDAYDLALLTSNQLSDLDTRIQESEFNSPGRIAPRRGIINYNPLTENGKTWFAVEFGEPTDTFILKAETAFIQQQSNGFFAVDPEKVWIMLSPALNSKTNRSQNFGVFENSTGIVSVTLVSESNATKFAYVLTPVAFTGNYPVRIIIPS